MFSEVSDSVLAGIVATVVGALLAAIAAMWKVGMVRLEIADQDHKRQIQSLTEEINSWKQIATEAMDQAEGAIRVKNWIIGATPPDVLKAVQPEHSSPPSDKQQRTADIATSRARVVANRLLLDKELGEPEQT